MTDSTSLRFILIFPSINPRGDFLFKDLPGSGMRIDVLCRTLAACFDWAPHTNATSEIEAIVSIGESKILQIKADPVCLGRGEVWWARVLKNSLKGSPPDFVRFMEGPLVSVLEGIKDSNHSYLYVLDESGAPFSTIKLKKGVSQYSFMVGDHRGFDAQTREMIVKLKIKSVSLGPVSLLGSHCVASIISHWERSKQ
ncbi:MAG: hypothetical protein ACFFEF_00870 [Candidatus Thorarchaeota archaeon]